MVKTIEFYHNVWQINCINKLLWTFEIIKIEFPGGRHDVELFCIENRKKIANFDVTPSIPVCLFFSLLAHLYWIKKQVYAFLSSIHHTNCVTRLPIFEMITCQIYQHKKINNFLLCLILKKEQKPYQLKLRVDI